MGSNSRPSTHGEAPRRCATHWGLLLWTSWFARYRAHPSLRTRLALSNTRARLSLSSTKILLNPHFPLGMEIPTAPSAEFSARKTGSVGCALRISTLFTCTNPSIYLSRRRTQHTIFQYTTLLDRPLQIWRQLHKNHEKERQTPE